MAQLPRAAFCCGCVIGSEGTTVRLYGGNTPDRPTVVAGQTRRVRRDPRDEGHHFVLGFGELATGAVAIDGSAGDADLVEPAGPFATQIQLVFTAVGSIVHLLLLEDRDTRRPRGSIRSRSTQ